MADRKSQGQPEGSTVPRRSEGCCQRQRGNGHQVIGAEPMKEAEREHRTRQHGGEYSWLTLSERSYFRVLQQKVHGHQREQDAVDGEDGRD